jgi:Rps23 Pro-64 3,4-dihydroxylase Tpa1-like proline 4-hydroxylase
MGTKRCQSMHRIDNPEITIHKNTRRWRTLSHLGHKEYVNAHPFPFIVIDDFLDRQEALAAARSFPPAHEKIWTNYIHVNEKKYGLNKREIIPAKLLKIINDLQGNEFLGILSQLTGIAGLTADDQLAGGGLHQTYPGGFLNIHSDFLIHPSKPNLKRRINLILFLSDDWQEDYGGDLQFWNRDMTECVTRIQPKFNRCVIFQTDEQSYHGCPDKLGGTAGFSRKSLALYYYSEYAKAPKKQFTDYKPRPEDGNRKLAIYLDSKAVAIYSWLKQRFNLKDDVVSNILRFIRLR